MSPAPIQLIVGLANPGKEYADTRHNAGAWFVEAIAEANHIDLRPTAKYHGLYASAVMPAKAGIHDGKDKSQIHLLIPTTFMNLSGRSVRACANFFKIPSQSILIVHDEIDLPVGTVKLKYDGGAGGHNGLTDIIQQLGTKQFYRLRIGVGHPGNSKEVVDYVLKNPSKADRHKIDDAIARAQSVLPLIIAGDISRAMQQLHTAGED